MFLDKPKIAMEQPKSGLRKRHVGHAENEEHDALHAKISSEKDLNGFGSHSSQTDDAIEQTVWGKPSGGKGQ